MPFTGIHHQPVQGLSQSERLGEPQERENSQRENNRRETIRREIREWSNRRRQENVALLKWLEAHYAELERFQKLGKAYHDLQMKTYQLNQLEGEIGAAGRKIFSIQTILERPEFLGYDKKEVGKFMKDHFRLGGDRGVLLQDRDRMLNELASAREEYHRL